MTPAGLVTTDIDRAVSALRSGGLVGLPTETVYGLGAASANVTAVARIFAVKGRPANHPLILHLGGVTDLETWATGLPDYAWRLGEFFWPGPLTMVLRRHPGQLYEHFAGNQPFVAIRVPAHDAALQLIAAVDGGIVAPSANRFGRVSPTDVSHVLDEIGDALIPGRDVILDGGPSSVGVESTIIDCTGDAPVILRPGAIGQDVIGNVGGVEVAHRRSEYRAPGTLTSHYAPRAKVIIADFLDAALDMIKNVREGDDSASENVTVIPPSGLLALASVPSPEGIVRLAAPRDDAEYARCLYAALRQADSLGLPYVIAIPPLGDGIAVAIQDRLSRASAEGLFR